MFESITNRLSGAFRVLAGKARISEDNITEALAEVRTALLEADVNLAVVRAFTERVREKVLGAKVIAGVDPGQQFIKAVYDELEALLGGEREPMHWSPSGPTVVMLCGLQGAGKTTTAAKLALRWKNEGRRPMLVAADVQRPAAVQQLKTLGAQIDVPVHFQEGATPVQICRQAFEMAPLHKIDTLVLDTAGRLHVDDLLMGELETIVKHTAPREILFVCDAMIGQSAVETATEFKRRLPLTGAVMTKLDSDARGGAALSLREVTGVAIKYVATGEKLDALEEFHPDRLARRILGMGDVVSLVEKAQAVVDEEEAEAMRQKMEKNDFSLADFLAQIGKIRKMGALKDIIGLLPGIGSQLKNIDLDDKEFKKFEAIIQSMTPDEREHPELINGNRRQRVANGSGRSVREVGDLLKHFGEMRKMMGNMGKMGLFSGPAGGLKAMSALSSGQLPGLGLARSLHGSKKAGTKAQQKKKDRKKKKRR